MNELIVIIRDIPRIRDVSPQPDSTLIVEVSDPFIIILSILDESDMIEMDENPGGSFEGDGKKLDDYIREYKRMGNHVKRYQFAKSFVTGKEVIEFGCGYGAGAVLLSPYIQRYIGIDIDRDAISYAKNNIEKVFSNTQFFELNNFINLSPTVKADVVVCFEVIEHVKDPIALISMLKDMTRANGKILLSTPNGLSSNGNVALFRTKFHIYEYTPSEFHNILKSHGEVFYFGERRKDSLDVRFLRNRAKNVQVENNSKVKASLPLVKNNLFNMAYEYFNRSCFWKVYPIDPMQENLLHFSTLIAVLSLTGKKT